MPLVPPSLYQSGVIRAEPGVETVVMQLYMCCFFPHEYLCCNVLPQEENLQGISI